MELEIRVSDFGGANKFQEQPYTQAIKQAFKHTLKQTKRRQWNLFTKRFPTPISQS